MDTRLKTNTSWGKVAPWYNQLVGTKGHYYHEHVIIPGVVRLLQLKPGDSVLDVGCGQGVLAKKIPTGVDYVGLDVSAELIQYARRIHEQDHASFIVGNAVKKLPFIEPFTHAIAILSLQNMNDQPRVLTNMCSVLVRSGTLVFVINHPCFRIPRQSGWDVDEKTKLQKRWLNKYRSIQEVPITMNPGEKSAKVTWSYHVPLSAYTEALTRAGCTIVAIEEWYSDKISVGKAAKMENRARSEFPLFMAIKAVKQ